MLGPPAHASYRETSLETSDNGYCSSMVTWCTTHTSLISHGLSIQTVCVPCCLLCVCLQMPRRLVAASCSLLNTAGPYGRHEAPILIGTGLTALFTAAHNNLISSRTGEPTSSSSGSLLHSMAQQLQQGGLLQLLPRLFTHAAELVQSPDQELLTAANTTT